MALCLSWRSWFCFNIYKQIHLLKLLKAAETKTLNTAGRRLTTHSSQNTIENKPDENNSLMP